MVLPDVVIRPAQKADVAPVTQLIHRSFMHWAREGLSLSPMHQTETQTASHLLEKGFVAVDNEGKIIGTFSVDDGYLAILPDGELLYREGEDSVIFQANGSTEIRSGDYLVFKKLAVCPSVGRAGLGQCLYRMAEDRARALGCCGIALETVREATWLFDWYKRLGFLEIGSHRYPGSQLDTLLMVKNF